MTVERPPIGRPAMDWDEAFVYYASLPDGRRTYRGGRRTVRRERPHRRAARSRGSLARTRSATQARRRPNGGRRADREAGGSAQHPVAPRRGDHRLVRRAAAGGHGEGHPVGSRPDDRLPPAARRQTSRRLPRLFARTQRSPRRPRSSGSSTSSTCCETCCAQDSSTSFSACSTPPAPTATSLIRRIRDEQRADVGTAGRRAVGLVPAAAASELFRAADARCRRRSCGSTRARCCSAAAPAAASRSRC